MENQVKIYENERPYAKSTGVFFQYPGQEPIEVIQIFNSFFANDSYGDRFQYYSIQTIRKKVKEFGAVVSKVKK